MDYMLHNRGDRRMTLPRNYMNKSLEIKFRMKKLYLWFLSKQTTDL